MNLSALVMMSALMADLMEIVGSVDAAEVQQTVLDVDGKMPFEVWDVHLDVRWGTLPRLGKVPEDV